MCRYKVLPTRMHTAGILDLAKQDQIYTEI